MTTEDTHRQVTIERIANSRYTVTNERGGQITVGSGDGADFTPVELMLTAIGGCTAIDVDILTSRRAEPDSFAVGFAWLLLHQEPSGTQFLGGAFILLGVVLVRLDES